MVPFPILTPGFTITPAQSHTPSSKIIDLFTGSSKIELLISIVDVP